MAKTHCNKQNTLNKRSKFITLTTTKKNFKVRINNKHMLIVTSETVIFMLSHMPMSIIDCNTRA